jgi:hypothetical protein
LAVTVEELEIVIKAKVDETVKNLSEEFEKQFSKMKKQLDFSESQNPLAKVQIAMQQSANAIIKENAKMQAQLKVINAKAQAQIETNLIKENAKRIKAQEALAKAAEGEKKRMQAAKEAAQGIIQQQQEIEKAAKRAAEQYQKQFEIKPSKPRVEPRTTSRLASEQRGVIPSSMRVFEQFDQDQIAAREAKASLQAIDDIIQKLSKDASQIPSALESVMEYFGEGISSDDLRKNLSQVDEILKNSFISGEITESSFRDSVKQAAENFEQMGQAARQASSQAGQAVKDIPVEGLNTKLEQLKGTAESIAGNLNSRIDLMKQKIDGLMGKYSEVAAKSGVGSEEAKGIEAQILSAQASLQRLSAQAEKVNQPIKEVKANTEKATKATKEYGNQVKKTTSSAGSGFQGLAAMVKKTALAFGAIVLAKKAVEKTVEFVKEGIKSAINAQEIENLFQVALGSMVEEAQAFADQMKKSLGVDQYQTKEMLATLQNLTTSMGIGTETAYKMSKSLTILANDMASFYNVSSEQAFENLQSAMTGESEAVKKYGYVLNETTIKQTALRYGLISSGQTMTEQQKVLARYLTLLEQSKNAQGDMANTIYGLQNQLRILQGNITGAARSIGEAFLPFIQAVVPWLNALAIVVQRVGVALASFTYGLFGRDYAAEKKQQQQIITGFGGIADAQTAAGNAAQAAGEKVKGALASFDQLNIIQQKSGGGSGGGGGGSGGGGGLDFDVPELNIPDIESPFEKMADTIMEKAKEIKNTLMNLGLDQVLGNFKTFFQDIYNQIKQYDFGSAIKTALLNGFDLAMSAINLGQKIVFPIAVALDIPGIVYEGINTIGALFQTLNSIVDSVTPGLENFVKIGLVPIATWVGGKIKEAFVFLQEILGKIGTWFQENSVLFTNLFTAVGNLTAAFWDFIEPLLNTAWEIFKGTLSLLVDIILKAAEFAIPLLTSVIDFLADHMNVLLPIVLGIGAAFATWKIIQTITGIIQKVSKATQAFSTIQTAFGLQMAVSTKAVTLQQVALGVLTGKLKLATVAQAAWKTVMAAIKSPMTWVITGIAALTAGIIALVSWEDEDTKRRKEVIKSVEDATKSFKELKDEQQEQLDTNLKEINNTKQLAEELKTIVDANGKIKEGYEARAQYIANELEESTGQEIGIIDGVVQKYMGLNDELDTNIGKHEDLKAKLEELVEPSGKIKDGEEKRAKILAEQLNKELGTNFEVTGDMITNYQNLSGEVDTQIEKEKALAEELKTLVDENGYVDEANRDRVAVILDELKPAMGEEYELINGQIEGYKGLQDEIDNTIEKQKLLAIVESQKALADEASKNLEEAAKNVTFFKDEIERVGAELAELENQTYTSAGVAAAIKTKKNELAGLQSNLADAQALVSNYLNNINTYNLNATRIMSDDAAEREKIYRDYLLSFGETTEEQIAIMESLVEAEEEALKQSEEQYKDTNSEVEKANLESQRKRLEDDKKYLQDLKQGVVSATPGFEQANENMGTAGATGLKEGLQNGKPAIEEVSKKISEALIAVFGEPAGKTVALGMQTSMNLAYGLESKESEVQNAAASISKAVLDVLGATVKQTINIGANLALNLANGMNSQKSKLKTVATNLAAAAATGLRSSASSSGGAETQTISNGRTRVAIPKLAQGGVLSTPSIVEVGEYIGARSNPEIVAPQNIMYDTVVEANRPMVVVINQIANRIIQAIQENKTEVNIGDDQIYSSAKKGGNKYSKMTGLPAF